MIACKELMLQSTGIYNNEFEHNSMGRNPLKILNYMHIILIFTK